MMIRQFASVLVALSLVCVWCQDDFDKQLSSANSELSDIEQDVQAVPPVAAVTNPVANEIPVVNDATLSSIITNQPEPVEAELQLPIPTEAALPDRSSKLPVSQQIAKLQKNMKKGSFVQTKLQTAITERSQKLQEAKGLLHRELNVLEQETLLKLREISKVKKLQMNIARMKEQAAEEDKLLGESNKRTILAQNGAEESEALDGSASRDLQWAKQRAADAHERLLTSQGVWQNERQTANAKIARLSNVIASMHKELTGEQSQGNRFEANSTVLSKQLQEIQSQIAVAAASKQNADINVAQIIRKWQDTLKQLREQVAMNSQLESQAKGGSDVQQQIQDLQQQMKQRDTQITDLQEQVDEATMQTGQGLRGVGNR